jgi:GDP-4-dehydro-6-deoxy-D-mannose reductase
VHTVFITGAEGFVGSRLLEQLQGRGYEAVAGVRNRARKLGYERRGWRALVCDVADPINVARAIAVVRPDYVLHLGGTSLPADAAAEPLLAFQSTVSACANILDAVRRVVPRAKVVIASAADVYGESAASGRPLTEDAPRQPLSTFGSLKNAAESVAATFFRDYRLNVTIARPFQYLGGHQPERFLFASIARQLSEWDSAPRGAQCAIPDPGYRRDFLHIADVVAAYERLMVDGRPNEAYNICSGELISQADLAGLIAAAAGVDVTFGDATAAPGATPIPTLAGDNTKLRTELRWEPLHPLADAVRELVAGYRAASVEPVGAPG